MSPMLHTSTSGSAGTSIQSPDGVRTCEAAELVLREQREQAVVGVLADTPLVRDSLSGRAG